MRSDEEKTKTGIVCGSNLPTNVDRVGREKAEARRCVQDEEECRGEGEMKKQDDRSFGFNGNLTTTSARRLILCWNIDPNGIGAVSILVFVGSRRIARSINRCLCIDQVGVSFARFLF
jgi:hypothetical protein